MANFFVEELQITANTTLTECRQRARDKAHLNSFMAAFANELEAMTEEDWLSDRRQLLMMGNTPPSSGRPK